MVACSWSIPVAQGLGFHLPFFQVVTHQLTMSSMFCSRFTRLGSRKRFPGKLEKAGGQIHLGRIDPPDGLPFGGGFLKRRPHFRISAAALEYNIQGFHFP